MAPLGPAPSEAGPSRLPAHPARAPTETTVPAYGLEFFEYRRRLFLAGLPLPPSPRGPLPETYTVPLPFPDPIPSPPNAPGPGSSSVGKLEALLQEEGAEETVEAWNAGLAGVHARLEGGKRLSKPLRLGLVIKVLKAGWIKDGTWPTDPITRRAAKPPSSPTAKPHSPQAERRTAPTPPMSTMRQPTPKPKLADLPTSNPIDRNGVPLPPRSTSLVKTHKQHDLTKDVKVGGNVWRGAKRDPAIDQGLSTEDHG